MKLLALLILAVALPASATVKLFLTVEGDPNPALSPGQTLIVDATLGSTVERVTAIDYFLSGGPVRVVSRDVSNSLYSDVLATDATLAGVDLGALLVDVGKPPVAGFYPLARITLAVMDDAKPGVYPITIRGGDTYGWSDASFADHAFDAGGSFNLTIVPEPSAWGFILLAYGLGSILIRRLK